jgi:hypothetical protein
MQRGKWSLVGALLVIAVISSGNPPPAPDETMNRRQAWQADLQMLSDSLLAKDRSFSPAAREQFRRDLARLEDSLPRPDDDAILVGISRLVALAGNAHTRFRLDQTPRGAFSTQFPIRMWFFQDGAYVIRTAPQYRRTLGCRVVAINGHALSELKHEVSRLFAGNASWTDYLAPIYLESPDVLHGLGILSAKDAATFTFVDGRGNRFDLLVRAFPVAQNWETWQELSPLFAADSTLPATALEPGRAPLYLTHPDRAYWFQFLPERQLLYFQFNMADNAPAGPTFQEFADSMMVFAASRAVRTLVVDLRLNSGGNLEVARDFIKELGQKTTAQLFVITGRCTFSACLYHAAQLKQFTHAIFVGEPVGDGLDYWAEGGMIQLPYSGAVIEYADGFHRYSLHEYAQNRPYYATLNVPALEPDIPVPMTSKDYFAGRDASLAAIERHTAP